MTSFELCIKTVKAILFACVIFLTATMLDVALAADPIVGKALVPPYPPSWFINLEDLRPVASAVPSPQFPLPQQNTQRAPIRLIARMTAMREHGKIVPPYRDAIWFPLNGGQSIEVQVNYVAGGGLLFGDQIPAECNGYLVLQRWAMDGCPTNRATIRPETATAVAKQWRDANTPVINIIPVGAEGVARSIAAGVRKPPEVISEAITVCGWSYSTAPYQVHCANVAVAFRVKTYDAYKAHGKLTDAIKESVYMGVLKATGRQKVGDLYPRIEDCDAATHISIAAHAVAYANALLSEEGPAISDFDKWFAEHPDATLREAFEAGKSIKCDSLLP